MTYLPLREVARRLNIAECTVRRLVVTGAMPASNLGTPNRALYRVSEFELDNWMEKCKNRPPVRS